MEDQYTKRSEPTDKEIEDAYQYFIVDAVKNGLVDEVEEIVGSPDLIEKFPNPSFPESLVLDFFNLKMSFLAIVSNWNGSGENLNRILSKNYPFNVSFDDLGIPVWCNNIFETDPKGGKYYLQISLDNNSTLELCLANFKNAFEKITIFAQNLGEDYFNQMIAEFYPFDQSLDEIYLNGIRNWLTPEMIGTVANFENIDISQDEEDFEPRQYAKQKLTEAFGHENEYSGSADWGGIPVWTVKGDKFLGLFVGIDDDDNVFFLERQEDSEEGYVNIEIDSIENENFKIEFDSFIQRVKDYVKSNLNESVANETLTKIKDVIKTKFPFLKFKEIAKHRLTFVDKNSEKAIKQMKTVIDFFKEEYKQFQINMKKTNDMVFLFIEDYDNLLEGKKEEKYFLVTEKSGRGEKPFETTETLIRKNWDLTDTDGDQDKTLEEFLDECYIGDTWNGPDRTHLTCIKIY